MLDWFTIVGTDAAALTQEQFDRALATPWAATIVDSCPATRAGWQLLLNAMTNGTLDEQRWRALGRVPPGTGDALLDPGYLKLQDALAASLPDGLLRALVEQPSEPRHVVSTVLADRLAALDYSPKDFVCRAGTSRWSPWTDEVLKRHQEGLEVSSDYLQLLCAKPATAARLARWLVSHKVFAADVGRDFLESTARRHGGPAAEGDGGGREGAGCRRVDTCRTPAPGPAARVPHRTLAGPGAAAGDPGLDRRVAGGQAARAGRLLERVAFPTRLSPPGRLVPQNPRKATGAPKCHEGPRLNRRGPSQPARPEGFEPPTS